MKTNEEKIKSTILGRQHIIEQYEALVRQFYPQEFNAPEDYGNPRDAAADMATIYIGKIMVPTPEDNSSNQAVSFYTYLQNCGCPTYWVKGLSHLWFEAPNAPVRRLIDMSAPPIINLMLPKGLLIDPDGEIINSIVIGSTPAGKPGVGIHIDLMPNFQIFLPPHQMWGFVATTECGTTWTVQIPEMQMLWQHQDVEGNKMFAYSTRGRGSVDVAKDADMIFNRHLLSIAANITVMMRPAIARLDSEPNWLIPS